MYYRSSHRFQEILGSKMELTTYLADKAMTHFSRQTGRRFHVACGNECKATHKDVRDLPSNLPEADTKIIARAADATSDGPTESHVHSLP